MEAGIRLDSALAGVLRRGKWWHKVVTSAKDEVAAIWACWCRHLVKGGEGRAVTPVREGNFVEL